LQIPNYVFISEMLINIYEHCIMTSKITAKILQTFQCTLH